MRLILPAVLSVLASPVLAQGAAPSNVNDCTLLQDAADLRRCIENFEGRGPAYAPPVTTAPKPPPAGQKAWLPATMHDRNEPRAKTTRKNGITSKQAGANGSAPPGETLDLLQGTPKPGEAEAAGMLDVR